MRVRVSPFAPLNLLSLNNLLISKAISGQLLQLCATLGHMPDMLKHTNVLRRTGSSVYYFRITIPTDLRPHFNGKKDVWRSLQTRDLREANRLAARIRVEWDDQFAELRAKDKAAVVVSLSDDDISPSFICTNLA